MFVDYIWSKRKSRKEKSALPAGNADSHMLRRDGLKNAKSGARSTRAVISR